MTTDSLFKEDDRAWQCCGNEMSRQWFMDGPSLVCKHPKCGLVWLWPLGYNLKNYTKDHSKERYDNDAWVPSDSVSLHHGIKKDPIILDTSE